MGKDSYEDIIDHPYHVSDHRPRMPMANRAAQFAPFAALTGYGDVVKETARLTDKEMELTEDEKADLVLNEEVKTALPKIVWPDGRRQSMTQKK